MFISTLESFKIGIGPVTAARRFIHHILDLVWQSGQISTIDNARTHFRPDEDILFDQRLPLREYQNSMIFELPNMDRDVLLKETYFSIGADFIGRLDKIANLQTLLKTQMASNCSFTFGSASAMLQMTAAMSAAGLRAVKGAHPGRWRMQQRSRWNITSA